MAGRLDRLLPRNPNRNEKTTRRMIMTSYTIQNPPGYCFGWFAETFEQKEVYLASPEEVEAGAWNDDLAR